MKVFISYSNHDRWAASRISEEIEELGAETFLDEKDIETGESIDQALRTHLSDCDHFLVLLSPLSIRSEWVLLELGGALTLGRKIIPVLLYVGVNEVPKAINLKLARDINHIERYYEELADKLGTKLPSRPRRRKAKPKKKAAPRFEVGDRVRIVATRPKDSFREELLYSWVDDMDSYLGLRTAIAAIREDGTCQLEIDGGNFGWVEEWLLPDTAS